MALLESRPGAAETTGRMVRHAQLKNALHRRHVDGDCARILELHLARG